MDKRRKVNKAASAKKFNSQAKRPHRRNSRTSKAGPMRGGVRA